VGNGLPESILYIITEAEKMSMYKYVRNLWKKPKEAMPELMRQRLILWRKQPSTIRIERPTRIDRARNLGYRAKEGFIIVRQRVGRGGHKRPTIRKGRRPRHSRQSMVLTARFCSSLMIRLCRRRSINKWRNN